MEEPARKRRKTASPDERATGSSPLKNPPRRPSFASPTKSSLARNYPTVLDSRTGLIARGKQARAFVMGESDVQQQLSQETGNGAAVQSSSMAENPRVERQRNTIAGHAMVEEGGLPETPSQRELEEQVEPRRGILFSSPSKRPPRRKDRVKQSPPKSKSTPTPKTQSEPVENDAPEAAVAKERQPPDPEVEKKRQEKSLLLREAQELDDQISRCSEEIKKLQDQGPEYILQPTEREDLISLINEITDANADVEGPATITSLLCSFLPFTARVVSPPKSKSEPVPSHKPLELDDPRPYLEMFTSFNFTSSLSIPEHQSPANQLHQQHTINIVGPQKLLTASLSLTVDTLSHKIVNLRLLSLSPFAERELGSFVRAKAQEENLGNACWAIGSYWEIAKKRAEFWHRCHSSFAHLILPGSTSEDTENAPKPSNSIKTSQIITRKHLSKHLGRDTLVLQDRHILLKIGWRIAFDWTGEAESNVFVESAVPTVWTEADAAESFKKIPETFNSLLQSKGVFEAVRIMVALLFLQ